uniref:Uncharacterized protein n=1 Tax=Arundo donax TaxID=35708 RepID=A0A0A9A3Y3_ARUDO
MTSWNRRFHLSV